MELKIRTISVSEKRAEIVLIQADPTRKGMFTSETRHLLCSNGRWTDNNKNVFQLDSKSFTLAVTS